MTTLNNYSWLRQLPKEILDHNESPPLGHIPSFDLQGFAKILKAALHFSKLDIKASSLNLLNGDELQNGYVDALVLPFKIAPLNGFAYFLIPKMGLELLLRTQLPKELTNTPLELELREAFEEYIILEASHAFQNCYPDKTLSPQFSPQSELVQEPMFSSDLEVNLENGSFPVRLLISESLRAALKEKFNAAPESSKILNEIYLNVHLEAGRVSLKKSEFDAIQKGDFLILDSCHLVPGEDKGRVLLTIHSKPFFRAKLKNNQIKILEYPLFYEENTTMGKESSRDEEIDEEYTEDTTEEYPDKDEETLSDAKEELEAPPEGAVQQKPFKADDISLDIVVEAGRFKMTVQKLMELKPGNLVELNITPESGVDLVLNGVVLAKGELLKIGETLGVRILDIVH